MVLPKSSTITTKKLRYMKTYVSFAIILLLLFNSLFAQTPIRKVLYKLAPSEIILTGEHIIQYATDGYKFALLTTDTLTKKNTLIFNGKRISLNNSYYSFGFLAYINVNEKDGYIIIDKNDNGYYVNNGGKIEGPYEYAWSDTDWYMWDYCNEAASPVVGLYGTKKYHYVLADRVYDNVDGSIRKSQGIFYVGSMDENFDDYIVAVNGIIERYSMPGDIYVSGNNYAYLGYNAITQEYTLFINGVITANAKSVRNIAVNEKGDYVYSYNNSHNIYGEYIVKNGSILNTDGYSEIADLHLTETGDVVYISNGTHLHLPDIQENNDFEYISCLRYCDKEHYAFCFKKNGKWYVRINGQPDNGPYDLCRDLLINSCGDYMYVYGENTQFIKTNRFVYGPFKAAHAIELSDKGKYTYDYCKDDNTIYRSIDGVTKSFFHYIEYNGISLDMDNHNFYSHYKYDYVVIDGKRVGNSAAIECRYDKKKNAFVWYSIEGRELVVYEYPLN